MIIKTNYPYICPRCGEDWLRSMEEEIFSYIDDGVIFSCPKCSTDIEITPCEWIIEYSTEEV